MLKKIILSLLFIFLNSLFAVSITKTSTIEDWDVSANISPVLTGDFKVCSSLVGLGYRSFGVSVSNASSLDTSIQWRFGSLNTSHFYIYHSSSKVHNGSDMVDTDILCISRVVDTIKFYKNDTLLYTSTNKSTADLLVHLAMATPNSIIKDITVNGNPVIFSNVINAKIEPISGTDVDLDVFQLNFLYGLSGIICASFLLFRIS